MTAPNIKIGPSLRKLENDLEVNKTTLHNWKKNRPKLYEFIIDSYQDRASLKENIMFLIKYSRIHNKNDKNTFFNYCFLSE